MRLSSFWMPSTSPAPIVPLEISAALNFPNGQPYALFDQNIEEFAIISAQHRS
jgi:hypothetical protein